MIAGLGGWWKALDLALGPHLHVHEQIERRRSLAAIDSHRGKGLPEIVAAIAMVLFATEFDVDRLVAGAQQHVVTAGRSIADKGEHRSPSIAVEHIASASVDRAILGAGILHRQPLGRVGGVERPGIDNLLSKGVGEFHELPLLHENGPTVASPNYPLVCRSTH